MLTGVCWGQEAREQWGWREASELLDDVSFRLGEMFQFQGPPLNYWRI